MKKKSFIIRTFLLVLLLVLLVLAQTVYADVLTDLGFSTSSQDLENYDQRANSQPYNSKNITISPVLELYLVEIQEDSDSPGETWLKRTLKGDNNLGDISETIPMDSDAAIKYVKAAALDISDSGKKHAVAELYYRDGSHGNGEIYLTIMDPAASLTDPVCDEVLVFSNSETDGPLITDYRNQHTFLSLVTGDFDNDGVDEIVVYVPDADNPRLALYKVVDKAIEATPAETFVLPGFSEFVYMTTGDITGDNLADLAVSYNASGTFENVSKAVYIFKSQDFSLSRPHIFNRLATSYNGGDHFISGIPNASVAIGNLAGEPGDVQMELEIAGRWKRYYYTSALGYRYSETTGDWDFEIVQSQIQHDMSPHVGFKDLNRNVLTTLACYGTYGQRSAIYIDGLWDFSSNYQNNDEWYNYVDYDVVTGNFSGNLHHRFEELAILRERLYYHGSTDEYERVCWEVAGSFPLDNNTICAALAAPDTDDDTVIMKYVGHELQYSSPTILAALASPPYFEDLEHLDGGDGYIGGSSTEISSGEGSGSETHGSVNVTAGAYGRVEGEISIFGIKIAQSECEEAFTIGYSWDTSHETEVTTSISYGTLGGQDSVAVYTIPMDVFKYEVWCPGVGGKGGYWTNLNQYFPYPAAYVVIPVDKYDEIAGREPDLPRIGGELFQHTLGRPETYHRSSAEMYKIKDPIEHNKFTTVGYGDAYTVQSIEITESSTNSHTFSANMSYRVGGGVAGAIVGITFDIGGGGGWSTSTIKNVGYTGTLANMPREAEDGGYSYAWKLVAYPYISDKGDQSFPVVTYAVDQIRRPPLLPQNMEMTDATSDSVTLTWDNVDPNVTGYQLYRYYDFEGNLAGYKKIGDVIPVGTTNYTDVDLQPYTYYSYKIQSIGSPYGGAVGKSILGSECSARTAPDGDAPLITQQPVSVEAASGTRAVFQVIAQPAAGAAVSDRIFYQWQRYVDGRWQTMKYEEDSQLTINGVRQESAGRYRCAISQYVQDTPITIYSDPVTLTVNKNNLNVELSFDPPNGHGDRNEPVTVTAKLKDIDVEIQPTGKINLVFISYPDPYVTVKEDGTQEIEYPDPISYFHEVELVDGKGQMEWRPADYGSYDITAVYLGDNNYHQRVSNTESFICVSDEPESVSGLRITGMPGNIMSYGAVADLGATVWRNGMETIMADEVEFLSSDPEGLEVLKSGGTSPQWHLTARKAGNYILTVETKGMRTLKVTRPITVKQVQVALKVKDQSISQGSEPGPIELELVEGELKLGDSLSDVFDFVSWHTVSDITPPGVYDIFVGDVTQNGDNYIITGVGSGTITVDGPAYNIKFRGVSNGTVTALINGWKVLGQNYTAGYDIVAGSAVRFNAIPAVGYKVEKWVLNGTEVKKEDGSYDTSAYITNNDLNVDISVEVYFVPDQCLLTYNAGANGTLSAKVGSLSVGNGATLPAQTVVSFLAAPNEGYMVSQWKINNSPLSDYTQDSYNHTVTRDTDVQVSFASVEYVAISYTAEGNGRVSAQTEQGADVGNNGLVTKGSNVVFTATPNSANSMVKEWVVNGEVVQGGSTVYTAQNIRQAIEVKAVFIDAITYTVTFGAIGHGTEALTAQVDGVAIASGSQVRGYEDVVFTAHPPAGWQVKQWKLGTGIIQDSDGQPLLSEIYTLEELKSGVTVSVEFESTYTYRVDYEVELEEEESEANGSLTARVTYAGISSDYDSGDEIKPDSRVVLTAVPDSGYTIEEWTVNGVVTSSTEPIYIITSIGADYEVTVKFALGTNPLTFAAVGSGKISAESEDGAISSDTILDDGVEVDFAAEPDAGYQVKEWRYNGEKVAGSTDSYTLTVSNGGFVEVEFEREYYTLILGENLSASVEGFDLQDNQVQGDSNVTVTASPPAGYLLTAWYEDGDLLSDELGDAYSFIMKQDTEITADFAPKSYGVTFDAGMNGTLTVTADEDRIISGAEQPGGCSLVFTAQPAEDYQVSAWYRDLTEVSGEPVEDSRDEIYVIDPLSKPEYIRVYFEQIPDEPIPVEYQVTFAAGNGGSISATADGLAISSGASVTAGSKLVFTAVPNTGKAVDAWSGTGNGTLSANKLIFTISSLSATENVRVTFKNASDGGGGSSGGGGGGNSGGSGGGSSKSGESEDLPPTPTGTLIGGEGGAILENGVTLTFPAGAVEDDIRVQVQEVSRSAGLSLPENSQLLSKVVDIVKDASGNFSRPVTITLSFDTSQADPEKFDIQICYYDEESGQWVPLDNIQMNLASGKVSGDINHFTKFAVLAVPKTVQPATPVQPSLSIPADLAGHWAEDNVMKLMEAGVISGYPDGSFRPDGTISRAEFTVMMVKALKPENGGGKVFADTASHWAKDSIATAFAKGIISGYDENCFGPDDPVTREQVALMITRITGAESSNGSVSFTDSVLISAWAQSGVAAAANSGLFVGYPDGSFRPQNNMTRAEAAVIVGRLLETKGDWE